MINEEMANTKPEFSAPEMKKVQSVIENQLRALILQVFNNEHGLKLLDLWDDIYIRQVTWMPGSPDGYAQFRAGQNNLVLSTRAILNQEKMKGSE